MKTWHTNSKTARSQPIVSDNSVKLHRLSQRTKALLLPFICSQIANVFKKDESSKYHSRKEETAVTSTASAFCFSNARKSQTKEFVSLKVEKLFTAIAYKSIKYRGTRQKKTQKSLR